MSLADLSIRRPTFITCLVLLMLSLGWLSMKRLGVDLFPEITFPVVVVTTPYSGAGPNEIETLVSKPIEEELVSISGLKRLSSTSQEGVSVVVAEFTLETDIKFAEQQIRDRVGAAKRNLPFDVKEPVIRRIDPSDQPVIQLSVNADLSAAKLYDLANEDLRPRFEQVPSVGLVEVIGGRKREIHVNLDQRKLKERELSASAVSMRLNAAGENIPAGKIDEGAREVIYRTLGQFGNVQDIGKTIVNFFGSEVPTTVNDIAVVVDTLEDEQNRTFVNGKSALMINIYKQSGSNTVAVVSAIKARIKVLEGELANMKGKPTLSMVRDSSVWIDANIQDVKESIFIGIFLAVLVVYFFLGSIRSTIITGLALPNSLIGAFVLMAAAGFTINIMSLLALSLSVGLLVDDAIVVRENIFRHLEMGKSPMDAALEGTAEVRLAVIATTLTVIAVFGPVAFLKGVVGQFFKQFGMTICFAMAISLFDALTIAPMLSAYFAGKAEEHDKKNFAVKAFSRFQDWLEKKYVELLHVTVKKPARVLVMATLIFLSSCGVSLLVPKTFLPPQDAGEFAVGFDLDTSASLSATQEVANQIDQIIRSHPEVEISALQVGGKSGESNRADFYVHLVPAKNRAFNTIQMKDLFRKELVQFAKYNIQVKDYDAVAGGQRPFQLNIIGSNQEEVEAFANKVFERLKGSKDLLDVDISTRPGKPEFQVIPDRQRSEGLGVSKIEMGQELRTLMEGATPAKYREEGREYDIRVRLKPEQRNIKDGFNQTYVPNINRQLIRLSNVAVGKEIRGSASIKRQDRGRYVSVTADIAPKGGGMGNVMSEISKWLETDLPLPQGMRAVYVGQAENFKELGESMLTAVLLGIIFIYLVLASLYESFVTPFTIMLALPLAVCGSFFMLAIAGQSLNIFSMIGVVMLMGVATKNSILLVDAANQSVREGKSREESIIEAGKKRLRPILMTTMALIAGSMPIAIGLNEASKQRTSMGWAIMGGLISSTLLTLVVVPAAYSYIDRFRVWGSGVMGKLFGVTSSEKSEVKLPS